MRKGSTKAAKATKATKKGATPVRRPVGKIVETTSPAELKRQIDQLLEDLHNATTRAQKKGIRRALRTRDYYISQKGGGLSHRAPATAE